MADEDEKISPDVFREQFSDAARELNGLPKQVISDNIKEKMSMELADKVWVALGISGVVFYRQHRLKKQIKQLVSLNMALNKENEVLHMVVGLIGEGVDTKALKKLVKF